MHRRLPPLNALKSFEAAARHLSFTKAADELFVTQAAVSHQIKALEDFLSMKLFLRRNRTLLLTEEGQAYFLELKDIFKNLQDATERLLAKGSKGAITVAMPPSFASQWLVPRIHKFSLAHPDIDVRIKAVDFDEGFLEDDVDVAIYYGKGRWAGLQADQLHREFLTPLCSPMLFQGPKNCAKNKKRDPKKDSVTIGSHQNSECFEYLLCCCGHCWWMDVANWRGWCSLMV